MPTTCGICQNKCLRSAFVMDQVGKSDTDFDKCREKSNISVVVYSACCASDSFVQERNAATGLSFWKINK